MAVKLNISLKDFNPSTVGFYKYILQKGSDSNPQNTAIIRPPDANELLEIIENEFDELHKQNTLAGVTEILDVVIQESDISATDYPNYLTNLFAKHSSNEEDHVIAAQIAFQILTALPTSFPIDQFNNSGFITQILQNNRVDNMKIQMHLARCFLVLIEKFQMNTLLDTIWTQILEKQSYSLVVHYIDSLISKSHIYKRTEFWQLIVSFLSSGDRDDRKLGTFFVRKILNHLWMAPTAVECDNIFYWSKELTNQLVTSWLTYLTILQNLEEKQSHLILPSLETLNAVSLGQQTPWIRIVLIQMLAHNNSLVIRWSVNYLLRNFSKLVLDNQILQEFLYATNNTWLYNENFLNIFESKTLSPSAQKIFLEKFANIAWRSVPMHAWLLRMKAVQWSRAENCKLVINIAARLRQLQNRYIRNDCRNIFISMFKSIIDHMALHDYMNFLDALYSSTDFLTDELLCTLVNKIQSNPRPFISFNVCTILRRQGIPLDKELILIDAFDRVELKDHLWIRILARFGFNPLNQETFCEKHYNLNIGLTNKPNLTLKEATLEFVSKISWDDFSTGVVREATCDWFVSRREATIDESDFENLLDSGGVQTLMSISTACTKSCRTNHKIINRLIKELATVAKKRANTDLLIRNIIESTSHTSQFHTYANEILNIDITNNSLALSLFNYLKFSNYDTNERQLLICGLLFGEPLNGDLRLEHDYAVRISSQESTVESAYKVRQTCLERLKKIDSISAINALKTDLIARSKSLSTRKPRYFENSHHHRLKLRIALALAALNRISPNWDDYYLSAILQENNQTNVTSIYDFIVAVTISSSKLIDQLQNLANLSASSQVSIIAITYLFIRKAQSSDTLDKLVELLAPWVMGSNFNTRLYAQGTLYKLFQIQSGGYNQLKIAIEKSITEISEKLATDVRYNFPDSLDFLNIDPILYVTIVPEDEYPSSQLEYLSRFENLKVARNLNLSKRELAKNKNENDFAHHATINDVQRKMNPGMGLNEDRSSDSKMSNMLVVASLIDKLPNLGGIARTCEVLGIKNLVLGSTKHAQSKEFKSLSMTAENWLNISEVKPKDLKEFLINKKTEGYETVGAEQTAKSINFMEFKFPNKCVLLLGHEKEGIPADLISLLDYAVEIPQYGMVRSLNVHVTGALFMYEYCKQHLSNPKIE